MYLRILAGGHAGEVRQFNPAVARVLLRDGRAEPEHKIAPVAEVAAVEFERTEPVIEVNGAAASSETSAPRQSTRPRRK